MRPVYISSNAFPVRTIDAIFRECDVRGIRYLELGSGVAHDPDARRKIKEKSGELEILLHNYIPAPAEPFVLNLASPDLEIREKSQTLVRTALTLSAEIGAAFYAVHSGFAYHARPELLGREQTHLPHFSLSEANKIFTASIYELSAEAKKCGVQLLIENNVVPAFNLTNKENKSYLLAGLEDSVALLRQCEPWGVRLLLDTGHLQVTAAALGFSVDAYVAACRPFIAAFQISENDRRSDQHLPIGADSWSLALVKQFPTVPVTIEVNGHLDEVVGSLPLIV